MGWWVYPLRLSPRESSLRRLKGLRGAFAKRRRTTWTLWQGTESTFVYRTRWGWKQTEWVDIPGRLVSCKWLNTYSNTNFLVLKFLGKKWSASGVAAWSLDLSFVWRSICQSYCILPGTFNSSPLEISPKGMDHLPSIIFCEFVSFRECWLYFQGSLYYQPKQHYQKGNLSKLWPSQKLTCPLKKGTIFISEISSSNHDFQVLYESSGVEKTWSQQQSYPPTQPGGRCTAGGFIGARHTPRRGETALGITWVCCDGWGHLARRMGSDGSWDYIKQNTVYTHSQVYRYRVISDILVKNP